MNARVAGLWLAVLWTGPAIAQPDRAEPGPEAAAAYDLLESDDEASRQQGCDSFLAQVRQGSTDPWIYRGAALCADQVEGTRSAVESAFAAHPEDSSFGLFGCGYLAYLDEELKTAEELLRQAVDQGPQLALAWNALGAVVLRRGDVEATVPLIEKALELAPGLELARNNVERARLYAGVFDRLETLLREIPQRWESLPEPRVPLSGKGPSVALASTTVEEARMAWRFISALALSPLEARSETIADWLKTHEPGEVDVWIPGLVAQRQRTRNTREEAMTLEAWLHWSQRLGRKDALLWAAGDAVNVLVRQRGTRGLVPVLDLWSHLGSPDKAAFALAYINLSHAQILFQSGEIEGALSTYRTTRRLFESVGDEFGQGNAFEGEATVLLLLGDNEGALSAYRTARRLFESVGAELGPGNSWRGEAAVLFRLGDNEGALSAYRTARRLFEMVGDQRGQGDTWRGEADVLFHLGDIEGSLSAYRTARRLFESVGDQRGQGDTWRGEADVLFRFGDSEDALSAYRTARQLFELMGDQLGQGNTFEGEAEVLFRLGKHKVALSAYRTARRLFELIGDQLGQGNALEGEAEVLFFFGDNEGALLAYRNSIERFDRWRAGQMTDTQRTSWEAIINPAYDRLIPALWRLGRPLAALERAEQARARVLLDLVATGHAASSKRSRVDLNLRQQREELASDLADVGRELAGEPAAERQRELLRRRRTLDARAEHLGFESLLSAGTPLEIGEPLDLAQLRATAREAGPSLLYYVAAGETFVFLLLDDGSEPVAEVLDLSRGKLRRRSRQLAESLANPNYQDAFDASARHLWRDLIGPVAERLPAGGPLTVVPHGPLHQVPFEALLDPDGKPLLERFELAVAPSISTLQQLRARHQPPKANDGLLALASGEGLTLPATEIRTIASLFDPKQAADFASTMARYRSYENLAPHARHLLIASQGTLAPGSRRRTYLEVEATDNHDGRLTAAEIATIPIDAELVTLAACDTGAAEALLSDERLDLTRAFLVAGAAAVLATRWKVPEDYRTSRFLLDFYRAYRRGGPDGQGMRKDQALTEARLRSRERGDPAQIWAAWVLVGDAR